MRVITLCGSTKFEDDFRRVNEMLTLNGDIVLAPGVFGHSRGITLRKEQKEKLDKLHKQKIDMSDAIYVINKGGYIGASTASEIEYALEHDKKIIYMEEVNEKSRAN